MKKFTKLFLFAAAFVACGTVANAQSNIDFETVGQSWTWTVFANGPSGSDVATNLTVPFANPSATGINTSANCAKFIEDPTAAPWGGFWSGNIGSFTINATNKIVKMMVYKDVISPVGVKLEGTTFPQVLVPNTKVNEWELLIFDFSGNIGQTFSKLTLLPDFPGTRTSGSTTYIDNITFGNGTTAVKSVSADVNAVSCYPNPAINQLTVSAKSEISQVVVRNLLGQTVKTVAINGLQKSIDVSAIAAGNYFVSVKLANGQSATQKFVKL